MTQENTVNVRKSSVSIQDMTKMSMCVALISICGFIAFPIPFSPVLVTATTFALGITALVLPTRQALIAIGVWVLLGAAGLPVFSGGQGGLGKLLGPSGGFFLGFFVSYGLVSYYKGKAHSALRYILLLIVVAIPITYVFGIAYMMVLLNIDVYKAMTMAMFPFIPGDLLKAVVAGMVAVRLNKIISNKK